MTGISWYEVGPPDARLVHHGWRSCGQVVTDCGAVFPEDGVTRLGIAPATESRCATCHEVVCADVLHEAVRAWVAALRTARAEAARREGLATPRSLWVRSMLAWVIALADVAPELTDDQLAEGLAGLAERTAGGFVIEGGGRGSG